MQNLVRLYACRDVQGTIASEEEDLPVAVEETYSGNYVVVFDPLDGCRSQPSPCVELLMTRTASPYVTHKLGLKLAQRAR